MIHQKPKLPPKTNISIGLLLIILGMLILSFNFNIIVKEIQSNTWIPVKAEVLPDKFWKEQKTNSNKGIYYIYYAKFNYFYEVNNIKYKGSKYDLHGKFSTTDKEKFQSFRNRLKNNHILEVFYNPSNHSESAVKTGITENTQVRLSFALFFLIIGIIVVYFNTKLILSSRKSSEV